MPTLRVRDLDLHYQLRGEGPPLLMMMGWRANLDWWPRELLAALERRHQLVLLDNRGSGRTGDPGGWYSIAQMADDAVALLDALGVREADVLGVSMGGMIAQEVALRHPARVDRLVLLCTHCGRHGARWSADMTVAWKRWLRRPWRLEEHLVYLLFSRELSATDPHFFAEFMKVVEAAPATRWASTKQYLAILRHDTYARLPRIHAPTLVVTGERDLMVAPENSQILARRIPDARLSTFPDAGHAILREKTADIDRLLAEFLASADRRHAA
jgi:pimeloyl-ACP methyl ester carboxylesterase